MSAPASWVQGMPMSVKSSSKLTRRKRDSQERPPMRRTVNTKTTTDAGFRASRDSMDSVGICNSLMRRLSRCLLCTHPSSAGLELPLCFVVLLLLWPSIAHTTVNDRPPPRCRATAACCCRLIRVAHKKRGACPCRNGGGCCLSHHLQPYPPVRGARPCRHAPTSTVATPRHCPLPRAFHAKRDEPRLPTVLRSSTTWRPQVHIWLLTRHPHRRFGCKVLLPGPQTRVVPQFRTCGELARIPAIHLRKGLHNALVFCPKAGGTGPGNGVRRLAWMYTASDTVGISAYFPWRVYLREKRVPFQ